MGRCGTSLTTRLIGQLGVDLGPAGDMLPAIEHDNARGYFEQHAIYEINEELLGLFGGSWADPPQLPARWLAAPEVQRLRERADRVLDELFAERRRGTWAFKDPRAAVTLPFWQSLVGAMDYVICVRNPLDVAGSLDARKGEHRVDTETSVSLWLRYVEEALSNTSDARRLIVHYEDYFRDTRGQLCRLAWFVLGRAPLESELDGLQSTVEATLWHHRDLRPTGAEQSPTVTKAILLHERLAAGDAGARTDPRTATAVV